MNKAQMRFGETIVILFVFFFLLVVGLIFYVKIKTVSVSQDITEFQDVRAVEVAQTISFLPEFQCSEVNVVEPNCFDIYKLLAMQETSKNNMAYYIREFGKVTIEIDLVYPEGETITPFNNEPLEYTLASQSNVPISLFNVTSGDYYFGVLRIISYQG